MNKSESKKLQQRNEAFYIKKRSLVRKAQQIIKHCESDIFIVIHKHDTDRMFSFSSSEQFDLAKVAQLIRKDVSERVQVKKHDKNVIQDFTKIDKHILDIQNLLDKQDCSSNCSTDNDTKEKSGLPINSNQINQGIQRCEQSEHYIMQTPQKKQHSYDVNRTSNKNEFTARSEFCHDRSSLFDNYQPHHIMQSAMPLKRSETSTKPFFYKTPPVGSLAPLNMNFDLSKVETEANENQQVPPFQSLTPRQIQSQFDKSGRQAAHVPYGEVRPLVNVSCMKDVPIPEVEEQVSTPKSNVQFKTPQNPSFKQTANNGWNQNQGPSQFQFGEMEQSDETLQFDQNRGFQSQRRDTQYLVQNTAEQRGHSFSVNSYAANYDNILDCDDIVQYNNWDDVRHEQK